MNAFSTANIKDKLCGGCDCTGFVPAVAASLNTSTNVLTLTDTTAYGTGAARKIIRFRISDHNAKEVIASMPGNDADGIITADVSSLDRSRGLTIQATVISDKGCVSDGSLYGFGLGLTAAAIVGWDKDNDAVTV